MKFLNLKNQLYFFLFLFLASLVACNKDESSNIVPSTTLSVTAKEPTTVSYNKVKLSAEIKDFGKGEITDCGFYINGAKHSVGIPTSKDFEYMADSLETLTTYAYYSYIKILVDGRTIIKRDSNPNLTFNSTFPKIDSVSNTLVADYSTIIIKGQGFSSNTNFYMVTKASPTEKADTIKMAAKLISSEEMDVKVPNLSAKGLEPEYPSYFEGAIQPCELYIGNSEKTMTQKVVDLDYKYRFYLNKTNGDSEDSFSVTIYYARKTPAIEDIEVYFGDTKCILTNKEERFDITYYGGSYEGIEGFILTYNIPFGFDSGSVNKVRVVSPFGEEFITNSINEFTID